MSAPALVLVSQQRSDDYLASCVADPTTQENMLVPVMLFAIAEEELVL